MTTEKLDQIAHQKKFLITDEEGFTQVTDLGFELYNNNKNLVEVEYPEFQENFYKKFSDIKDKKILSDMLILSTIYTIVGINYKKTK